jgi:transcriptional regulator with XRE-family HTH domain
MNMVKGNLEFGLWLREKRINLGYTILDFSNICELSYVTISNIELGKVMPGIHATKQISKALSMEYVDLRQIIKTIGG